MVKKGRQPQKVVVVGEGLVAGISSHGLTEPDHVASSCSRPGPLLLPQPPPTKMSVSLNPSTSLGFRSILLFIIRWLSLLNTLWTGPFTSLVKRSLTITNNNSQPVAFKVKTTAPKVRSSAEGIDPAHIFIIFSYTVYDLTRVELNHGRPSRSLVSTVCHVGVVIFD